MRSHKIDLESSSWVEPLTYLRKAQYQWEKRIQKSLNSMCNEIGIQLSRYRLPSDRDDMKDKWTELSTYEVDLTQYRPVYAPKDFLEVLVSLKSSNYRSVEGEGTWDFTQIPLKVKSLAELRTFYKELSRGESVIGTNSYNNPNPYFNALENERIALGEKVLNSKHAPVAQEFLKKGSPRCLRGKIWCQVLGSEATVDNSKYFDQLKSNVLTYDLLIDKLTIKDVQLTASNDDQYFVFEDLLYQILLCFSRDTEILSIFERSSASPLYGPLKNKSSNTENLVVYPPSGIIPFHGFTMYATPFCYLYDDVIALYFTFRAFYLRYFYHLHQVSSDEQSILSLCILFYRLLQRYEPQLFLHFKTIHIHPIKIVFKWIMRCFSGHLPPDQILYLWDLILAYDSLEIISVLAVAILSFRRDNLMQVDTLQNVEAVIADLSSINVMTLLQFALMKE